MKNTILFILLFVFSFNIKAQAPREVKNIDFDWFFLNKDINNGENNSTDYSLWERIDVPHDYSIEGEYSKDNRRENGFLPGGGIVWYKKEIFWDDKWAGKEVNIEFDGAYMNSTVWINGNKLGYYPNGYFGFNYNLTKFLKKGKNVLTVKLDNTKLPSARWYAGIGIYRHVNLIITNPIHISRFGTYVRTENISSAASTVCVDVEVETPEICPLEVDIISIIRNESGEEICRKNKSGFISNKKSCIKDTLNIKRPELWSPSSPSCYYIENKVVYQCDTVDATITRFGVRKIEFIPNKGFKLNGNSMKLKGVCLHQNMGAVGTALTDEMWMKRLLQLKEMGCNAIRTSHYPYPPIFYELCDTLGFMVVDEPWDGWFNWYGCHKATYDYSYYFLDWWEEDLSNFIKRDRSHPSLIMWCLGNEVWGYDRHMYLQYKMNKIFYDLDPTRPTTQAYCLGKYIDIAGFNANGECRGDISDFHKKDSLMLAVGTEIPHTRQTRGVYRTVGTYKPWESNEVLSSADSLRVFPITSFTKNEVFEDVNPCYASSYDNQTRRISAREQWKQTRDNDFMIGQFIWTGADYLGESWGWPGRTNNYGIIDLAGFEKDHYYLYQSLWSDKPMIHILPNWTHPGKEGVSIPVVAYTNGDCAELFLNGKSMGKKEMNKDSLQIVWLVPYKKGTLKAVAYKNGKVIAKTLCKTASKPYALKLTSDRKEMIANKRDVAYVTVDVVDSDGNFVPNSDFVVNFDVNGDYKLIGTENGDILDVSKHKILSRKTFKGKVLLILQAKDKKGKLIISAKNSYLKPSSITINLI